MAEYIVPRRIYVAVWFALVCLTALTTTVATVDLGVFNPIVAMTIAIVKATLVVLFFMHLRYSSRVVQLVAGAAIFWLLLLFGLTMSDYLTRVVVTVPSPY
jgi:cytochrome c oxidase subunit IV